MLQTGLSINVITSSCSSWSFTVAWLEVLREEKSCGLLSNFTLKDKC